MPELRLDWWDTIANRQRTAVLPAQRVSVLPSELSQSASVSPPAAGIMPDVSTGVSAGETILSTNANLWKLTTGAVAVLWLLTLMIYFRRGPVKAPSPDSNGSTSLAEKELLKMSRMNREVHVRICEGLGG